MKERPIIFNDEMVRAILDGRKTQTRRPVNPDLTRYETDGVPGFQDKYGDHHETVTRFPFGKVGDRLWVRECWYQDRRQESPAVMLDGTCVYHPDDFYTKPPTANVEGIKTNEMWRKRPSIHMPRWASRITLEITGVRVERLNDISDDDAWNEGIDQTEALSLGTTKDAARAVFSALWQSIYGPESWTSNPWVWVVEFKRVTP